MGWILATPNVFKRRFQMASCWHVFWLPYQPGKCAFPEL